MRRCGKLNTWCEQHQQSLESLNWDQNRRGEPRNRRRRFLEIRATNDRYTIQQILNGWLAQLIEHLLYTQNVIGLNPVPPTILIGHKCYGSIRALGAWGDSSILSWPTILLGIWCNRSHASFRSSWRNPWGFKSLYAHQFKKWL